MIKLDNVTLLTTKGDSEPINFVAENKVNYLQADQKNLFKVLSIKQQYIKDGVMSIDDFTLFPLKDQRKYAFVLAVNSQVITLNAVFVFELSFKDKSRSLLKQDLITLREMSLAEPENKIAKIDAIFDMLRKHNVSYVLIDGNDPINKENRLLINETLDRLQEMCVLFLRPAVKMSEVVVNEDFNIDDVKEDLEANKTNTSDEVKDEQTEQESKAQEELLDVSDAKEDVLISNSEENKTNDNIQIADYEKEFKNFDLPAQYDLAEKEVIKDCERIGKTSFKNALICNKPAVFVKTMCKHLYLYYLFTALFTLFLSVCSFSSIYLIKSNNGLIAGILIFLDIVFVFMHLYILGSTYAGLQSKLTTKLQKIGFIILFIIFTIIGLGIGFGFIAILSSNQVFVDLTKYVMSDWVLGIIVSAIAILSPFAVHPLAIVYKKLAKLLSKYLPKKADE